MTFLDDLWKKFKTDPVQKPTVVQVGLEKPTISEASAASTASAVSAASTASTTSTMSVSKDIQETKAALKQTKNDYLDIAEEHLHSDNMLNNLKALQNALEQPKEELPELRFTQVIKKQLGEVEAHETVRQDRWPENIRCPNCQSINLKRIVQVPPSPVTNHRYRCLDCDEVFSDDSGTPFEKGVPPLNVWMQCWYLMGCTDSLNYITAKLNLDFATVEAMVRQLRKIFNAQKPLTNFLKYEDWNKQADLLRKQLQEELLKQYEQLDANVATAPKDSAEFRRQQIRRRTGETSIEPSSTIGPKKKF